MAVQISRTRREELIRAVRRAGAAHPGQYLSAERWDRWVARSGQPPSARMRYWFGSWPAVLDAAGLPGCETYRRDDAPLAPAPSLAEEIFADLTTATGAAPCETGLHRGAPPA